MGIFSKKTKNVERVSISQLEQNRMEMADKSTDVESVKPEPFVADISMYELENANWVEFAALLKQNRVLPNSYIKTPAEVKVALGENNRPMALVTYLSATSSSMREFLLLQDGVFQSINGVSDEGKDKKLNELWKEFQNEIRYLNYLNTNREGLFHKMKSERMMAMAKKMSRYDRMYELEQEFFNKYKESKFDDVSYATFYFLDDYHRNVGGNIPAFIPLKKTLDGHFVEGEPIVPFSPKTLEFCISHLTDGCMVEMGEYPDNFEEMCRKIQEFSLYESEDWDKVIKKGKEIVKSHFQVYCQENGFECQ